MVSYELLAEVGGSIPAAGERPSRSAAYKAKNFASLVADEKSTLYDTFEKSCSQFSDKPCLGYRGVDANGNAGDFTFMTYKEVQDKVKAFSSSLKEAGVQKGQRVAIFGANSCEWMIAMQVQLFNYPTV
jgi:long-chain acyl-CoA synthetase